MQAYDDKALESNPNALKTSFSYDNFDFKDAADVGNFHAGFTGTYAKISYIDQWRGAGAAEMAKDKDWEKIRNPITYFSPPYGDKPKDFKWNTRGMNEAAKELRIPRPNMSLVRMMPDE